MWPPRSQVQERPMRRCARWPESSRNTAPAARHRGAVCRRYLFGGTTMPSVGQTARPAQIEKEVWVGNVDDLLRLIPVDCSLVRELLQRKFAHVEAGARDA